jgi:hypothetical protein
MGLYNNDPCTHGLIMQRHGQTLHEMEEKTNYIMLKSKWNRVNQIKN